MCNCISTTVWDLGTQICEILVITTCICRFSPLKCMFSVICRWTQEDFLCLYFCAIQVLCWVQMWAHLEHSLKICWIANFNHFLCSRCCMENSELWVFSFLSLPFYGRPFAKLNLLTPISNFFGWIIVIWKSIFRVCDIISFRQRTCWRGHRLGPGCSELVYGNIFLPIRITSFGRRFGLPWQDRCAWHHIVSFLSNVSLGSSDRLTELKIPNTTYDDAVAIPWMVDYKKTYHRLIAILCSKFWSCLRT